MDPEQEPDLTDKSDVDPSIDPKVLIEQEGPNIGAVAAVETGNGVMGFPDEVGRVGNTPFPTVEGLPVIGAEAEEKSRNKMAKLEEEESVGGYFRHTKPYEQGEMGAYVDKQGTEAMTAEVSRRAIALQPDATEDEKLVIGGEAATNLRSELQPKSMPAEAIKAELENDYQVAGHPSESQIRESAEKLVPDIASEKLKSQVVEEVVDMFKEKQADPGTL